MIVSVFVFYFILPVLLLPTGALPGQEPSEKSQPRARRVLAAGEQFVDRRLGLTFTVPLTSVVLVRNRGNFHGVDVEPVDDASFYIYHTSYRIRRSDGVGASVFDSLRSVFGPCEMPPVPAGAEFEINARCDGTIGMNRIVRHIRLIRDQSTLHLLHVSSRADAGDVANKILASVQRNQEFIEWNEGEPDEADAEIDSQAP